MTIALQKGRNGQVKENDVVMNFLPDTSDEAGDSYSVTARGKNKYGPFVVKGTARKNKLDGSYKLHLEKEVSATDRQSSSATMTRIAGANREDRRMK